MNKWFPLKHWFLTALLGTVLSVLLTVSMDASLRFGQDAGVFLAFGLYVALVYSLPVLLLYYLLFFRLQKMPYPLPVKRKILVGSALLMMAITFWAVNFSTADGAIMVPFLLTALATGFLLPLQKK